MKRAIPLVLLDLRQAGRQSNEVLVDSKSPLLIALLGYLRCLMKERYYGSVTNKFWSVFKPGMCLVS